MLFPLLIITFIGIRIVYQIYFHSLSKFPGRKPAACTGLVEFYFNITKNGVYIGEIERMHYVACVIHNPVYMALGIDEITEYCFRSLFGYPNGPDYKNNLREMVLSFLFYIAIC